MEESGQSIADYIKKNSYKKICIEVPMHLFHLANQLQRKLIEKLDSSVEFFIVPSSQKEVCSHSGITISHISGIDFVISYCNPCVCSSSIIPTLHVSGVDIDVEDFCTQLKEKIPNIDLVDEKYLVLLDLPFYHAIDEINSRMESFPSFFVCKLPEYFKKKSISIDSDTDMKNEMLLYTPSLQSQDINDEVKYCVKYCGYELPIKDKNFLTDYKVIFVSINSQIIDRWALNFSNNIKWIYSPKEKTLLELSMDMKPLKRAFFCIEKAKKAAKVGILLISSSSDLEKNSMQKMVEILESLIQKKNNNNRDEQDEEEEIRSYVISLSTSHIDDCLLGNFPEIDVFVLIACTYSGDFFGLFNSFLKPVMTPFDFILAFSSNWQFTGQYTTDVMALIEFLNHQNNRIVFLDNSQSK